MSQILPVLAAISGSETLSFWNKLGAHARNHVTLFGAIAALVLVLFAWALFIRERRRQEPRYHYPHPPTPGDSRSDEGSRPHRRKWRRRRREHRPRNPTLAETGGLPPVRSGEGPDHPV